VTDYAKYRQKYQETLQPLVPEPIVTVGLLSISGAGAAGAMRMASPLAGRLMGRSASKQAGGLPKDLVLAITATSIHAFGYKPKGSGIKTKGDPFVWARSDLRVTPAAGQAWGSKVWFDFDDAGERLELETSPFMGGEFNQPMFDLFATSYPSGAAPAAPPVQAAAPPPPPPPPPA